MTVSPEIAVAPDVQALAGEYPEYVAALARHRRWNYSANMLDSGTFALTKAALNETTVLRQPDDVKRLRHRSIPVNRLAGAVPASTDRRLPGSQRHPAQTLHRPA